VAVVQSSSPDLASATAPVAISGLFNCPFCPNCRTFKYRKSYEKHLLQHGVDYVKHPYLVVRSSQRDDPTAQNSSMSVLWHFHDFLGVNSWIGVHWIQIRIRPDIRWIWWIQVGSGRIQCIWIRSDVGSVKYWPDLHNYDIKHHSILSFQEMTHHMTTQNCVRKLNNSVSVQYS